jgi:hypothetical protein
MIESLGLRSINSKEESKFMRKVRKEGKNKA